MVLIEKLHFTLREIAERWHVQMDDLAYMAENGELRVSVVCTPCALRRESTSTTRATAILTGSRSINRGSADCRILTARDAHRVFLHGEVRVTHFHAQGDAYVEIIEPSEEVVVSFDSW